MQQSEPKGYNGGGGSVGTTEGLSSADFRVFDPSAFRLLLLALCGFLLS